MKLTKHGKVLSDPEMTASFSLLCYYSLLSTCQDCALLSPRWPSQNTVLKCVFPAVFPAHTRPLVEMATDTVARGQLRVVGVGGGGEWGETEQRWWEGEPVLDTVISLITVFEN